MKQVAVSIGDLNGIGIQLALEQHHTVCELVKPVYCIDRTMLEQAANKLKLPIPENFRCVEGIAPFFAIRAGEVTKESGAYAYASFVKAVELAKGGAVDAITTLPIHKKAWELADVKYKGHTDALRDFFKSDAIMMLGCPQMYVALYTEHIPLKEVAGKLNVEDLARFFVDFYLAAKPQDTVGVLGLNPHAGDDGVLGDEERMIEEAVEKAHRRIGKKVFSAPLVPDIAFTPRVRARYTHYIAMYHDQGLAPLKALYFDEGINVSLNLPILRTSVDHGTAFDVAYRQFQLNGLSYTNAIKYIKEQR